MQDGIIETIKELGDGYQIAVRSRPALAGNQTTLKAKGLGEVAIESYPNGVRVVEVNGAKELRVSDLDLAYIVKDGTLLTNANEIDSIVEKLNRNINKSYDTKIDLVQHPDLKSGVDQGIKDAITAANKNTITFLFNKKGYSDYAPYKESISRFLPKR